MMEYVDLKTIIAGIIILVVGKIWSYFSKISKLEKKIDVLETKLDILQRTQPDITKIIEIISKKDE